MALKDLNRENLLKTLRCLADGNAEPPAGMLDIMLLADLTDLPDVARAVTLYQRLETLTLGKLTYYRESAGINDARDVGSLAGIAESLARDLNPARVPPEQLAGWSAVYHRFFTPSIYKSSQLAAELILSRRQFDRYIHDGADYLLWLLIEIELGVAVFAD